VGEVQVEGSPIQYILLALHWVDLALDKERAQTTQKSGHRRLAHIEVAQS